MNKYRPSSHCILISQLLPLSGWMFNAFWGPRQYQHGLLEHSPSIEDFGFCQLYCIGCHRRVSLCINQYPIQIPKKIYIHEISPLYSHYSTIISPHFLPKSPAECPACRGLGRSVQSRGGHQGINLAQGSAWRGYPCRRGCPLG